MTISQVYEKFGIPRNLREHMMRVGSLATAILGAWKGDMPERNRIIQTCLLHDIAKPMSFNLANNTHFKRSPAEHERLLKLREWLVATYGADEHKATVAIAKELGCDSGAIRILEEMEWENLGRLLDRNDASAILPIYCDMRVGPSGVLTLAERLENLISRATVTDPEKIAESGRRAEVFIQGFIRRDLGGILHEEIESSLEQWMDAEILHPFNPS